VAAFGLGRLEARQNRGPEHLKGAQSNRSCVKQEEGGGAHGIRVTAKLIGWTSPVSSDGRLLHAPCAYRLIHTPFVTPISHIRSSLPPPVPNSIPPPPTRASCRARCDWFALP